MTYEDERGVSGRLAADNGYGTPPESYGGQQHEPMAPDRRDERGEPGQEWQGTPAQERAGAADEEEFEYWPSTEEPAGLPTAGRPPAEVAAALDYGAGSGRQRAGGLHAPLPAGENAYVDWIKGLGTADAASEEWANADPRGFDTDGDAPAGDWPDGDAAAGDWPHADATDPDDGGEPGEPAPEWTPAAEAAGGSPAAEEENWFEPKPRPENSGQGGAERLEAALPASGTASEEENWFEPKPRNDPPEYPRPAIAAQSATPSFGPPALTAGTDWPRSAEELDFVTPEQAAGSAGFGAAEYRGGGYQPAEYQPAEYQSGGYDGFGAAGQGNPDEPRPYPTPDYPAPDYLASDYPTEYGDDRAGEYDAAEYRGPYDEAPEDRAVAHLDDAETTTLMLGGGRKSPQRRTSRSYRPFAIAAGVVVAATVGVVGVALHDSSAQSANPDPPVSTGSPAAPPTDTGSPAVLLPPLDSATASPPPSVPTTAPTTRSRPVRTTAAPRPTRTHPTPPPPPPTHTPTPPTSTPTKTPTTAPPATGTSTPTPTDTSTDPTG